MNPSWQQPVPGPAIHALIIGVADYPNTGAGAASEYLRKLRPLTSSAASAVQIAQHLVTAPELVPLVASVDLLISGGVQAPAGWTVRPPTRANIQAAFSAWKTRASNDPNNILLFYFCGHGYQKSELVVLPEDIGANIDNPLFEAINISKTHLAMSQSPVRTQLWLVDACREAPRDVVEALDHEAASLMTPRPQGQAGLDSTLLAATTSFLKASGVPGGLSLFASALLEALKGAAATKEGNRWVVRTGGFQRAINTMLRLDAERNGEQPQQCECLGGTGEGELFSFAEPPPALVRVKCEPTEHHTRVELYLRNDQSVYRYGPLPGPWETQVASGFWTLGATPSPDEQIRPTEQLCCVLPPITDEVLKWPR